MTLNINPGIRTTSLVVLDHQQETVYPEIYKRQVLPSNEEKCFVDVIHTDMHSENIMVKKSKPSVKGEPIASVKEEPIVSVKEEPITSGKDGERIDFFYVLAGGGILIGVILVIFIILRYVLPTI